MEDLSTMGAPTTWDAVGVGDEVVARCALRARWIRGVVSETQPASHIAACIDEHWFCGCDPVRLLSRASDPITTDCAGLDDIKGLAEGVTRAVKRAAAVTAAVGAESPGESPPRAASSAALPVESTQGTPIEGLATVGEAVALHAYVAAREERHALAMAIREVCGMTDDEPDGDLAERLRERVTGLRDTANTLNNQLAEADGEIKSLTYRMDEIEALVEAAAVLSREPVYPISKAVRVALLRSVRA